LNAWPGADPPSLELGPGEFLAAGLCGRRGFYVGFAAGVDRLLDMSSRDAR